MTVHLREQSLKVISIKQRVKYLKLLFKWKGGVWNLLWIDFIWFLGAHILITILYQFILMRYPIHRTNFESFLTYMNNLRSLVPLSFLLGFFVSAVLARWWEVVMLIPWLSKGSFYCQSYITGNLTHSGDSPSKPLVSEMTKEKELHKIRVSILRYMNMAWIFTFVNFSLTIKKRFSIRKGCTNKMHKMKKQLLKSKRSDRVTVRERAESIIADPVIKLYFGEKFILEEEIAFLEKQEQLLSKNKTLTLDYWIPLQWALMVIRKAYKMGHITESRFYEALIEMVNEFRGQLGTLYVYNDWKMPLVYIQVVIFVVYSFLFTEIFSQQIIKDNDVNIRRFHFQTYFPILTILKYFLYMGWFQIGLCLMYPFDGNSADMPLNDVLNFNIMIATQGCRTTPDMFPEFLRQEFGSDQEQIKKLTEFTKDSTPLPIAEIFSDDDNEDNQKSTGIEIEDTKEIA